MKAKVVFTVFLAIIFLMACEEKEDPKPAPVADFKVLETNVEVYTPVEFVTECENNPTSLSWHFVGGTPEYSSEWMPVVTYSTPGEYEVSLTVSNEDGEDTEIKHAYIKVSDNRVKIHGQVNGVTSPLTLFNLVALFPDNSFAGMDSCVLTGAYTFEAIASKSLLGRTATLRGEFSIVGGAGNLNGPTVTLEKNNEVVLTYSGK